MSEGSKIGPYVLGIDLGSHSLGWAVLTLDEQGQRRGIRDAGVRTFQAGVEASYDQMIQGKQKSKAANRRSKRGPRRQIWRRAWRRYKLLKCLITHGLLRDLGSLDIRKPADQDRFLKSIDQDLRQRLRPAKDDPRRHLWEQVWLYELRASALERKLDPLELGRAFYHLAQRRGFLSNRKTDAPDDEDDKPKRASRARKAKAKRTPLPENESEQQPAVASDDGKEDPKKVKAAITKLGQDMERAIPDPRFRTLGFYFARHVNPEEQRIRGPGRWTGRLEHYEPEFKAICDAQSAYYPALAENGDGRRELHDAIFFQRPLKPCGHLVGHCDLEPGRKRALQAIPLAQRFRLLQKVNDLAVIEPSGNSRPLRDDERARLLTELSTRDHLTFHQIRDLLQLQKARRRKDPKTGKMRVVDPGHTFNFERPPAKDITGHRTAAKIISCDEKASGIAQCWDDMSDRQREELVLALLDFEDDQPLAEHLADRYGFTDDQAAVLSRVQLEKSRCSLSRRAMARLLPFMEDGIPFATAKEQIREYRAKFVRQTVALDSLPRVLATDHKHVAERDGQNRAFKNARDLRNPAVTRALSELRKVINASIRRYGKPERIHVELGRELKGSPKQRQATSKRNAERRVDRDRARQQIVDAEVGWSDPSALPDSEVQKWLLGKEQGWHCPYCGESMPKASTDLQVDHIIPRSISHDNTMLNKVLCHAQCNSRKGKRAPCQAFDQEELHRIAKRTVSLPPGKRRRFQWTEDDIHDYYADESGGFTKRQLQDTQYASRLAGEYLALLYGGVIDDSGVRRVQVSSGGVTFSLRREWGLNAVIPSLPDSPAYTAAPEIRLDEKLRTDHRHHAVDAVVIALTNRKTIELLSDAARRVELAELHRQDVRDSQGRRRTSYAEMKAPWGTPESFFASVKDAIARINVSHRPERKLSGPMHDETNYSKPFDHGKRGEEHRTRRALKDLKKSEVEQIIDDGVRKAVQASLQGGEPKAVFTSESKLPVLGQTPDGKDVLIKSVRISVKAKPVVVRDKSGRERYVKPGSNHHITVVGILNPDGTERKWEQGEIVSRLDAMRRWRDKQQVIRTGSRVGTRHVFALQPGDMLQITRPNEPQRLFVIRSISNKRIEYVSANDARKKDASKTEDKKNTIKGAKEWFVMTTIDYLRQWHAKKVTVSPIGDIVLENKNHRSAND
ncbi:MAG TPA: type II CRISPR RNA-guided endonuclease Cas9 [Phycisphaerae bacterium]|nr:type II CRISPR RNA-guided endonuclease Cas9 [Phycisphaerae bacterium]